MLSKPELDTLLRLAERGIGRENGVSVRELRENPGVDVDTAREMADEYGTVKVDDSGDEMTVYLDRYGVVTAVILSEMTNQNASAFTTLGY